ncbi:hypothetical protein ACIFOT_19875 [Neobacillus sp. NRS-1170]|uniref:hypothetical protein n=1 Tax=Neobacillus sp. NRS-1170 TaxID=3233898 RepID=UPI003D28AD98
MDKKQKISWGVSFGSLALVAGMVSYLGLSNGDKATNQVAIDQGQPSNNNSNQQTQDNFNFGQQPEQGSSWGGDSQFNQNDQGTADNFGSDNQSGNSSGQDQFSNGSGPGFGHHGGFDTTTGGT